jgi:hypothetical protein
MFHPLDIFKTDSDGGVLGAVRQKPWWLPRHASKNWQSLPPVSTLSSINARATKFASCCCRPVFASNDAIGL